jgi:AbrB family looped-hinge helix DNA binding protein
MQTARITSTGKITIPNEIKRDLGVKNGDKIVFIKNENKITIENPTLLAFEKLHNACKRDVQRLGIETDEDVINLIKEVRKANENNA